MEQRFGFIHDEMELKILLLFILKHITSPVPREELTDTTLLCDNGIGYFEFSECLADLVRTGHIDLREGLYSITEKGLENGGATEAGLPYSVRIRAEKAASALSNKLSRDSMISTSHELRQKGGFTVRLSMSDGVGPVLSMELLCGDDKAAHRMEESFRKNAEAIHAKIVELLLTKG